MTSLTIPRRIGIGLVILVALAILLGTVALWQITGIDRHIQVLSGNSLPSVVELSRIAQSNFMAMKAVRTALLAAVERDRDLLTASRADFETATKEGSRLCDTYNTLLSDQEDRRLFTAARTNRDRFLESARETFELTSAGKDAEARRLMRETVEPAAKAALALLDEDIAYNITSATREVADARNKVRRGFVVIGTAVGLATLLGIWLGTGLSRSTKRVLREIADTLEMGAARTAEASDQLAVVSRTVASGCADQGSAVTETGAALEQMSAMIRCTADNAAQAKELARQARAAASGGTDAMADMDAAMKSIGAASIEVAKIVRQIDEIAFQTNILALNAAVEAARAGEAGAGFAVVADEVRSLAQRSAAAARETAGRIEAAIDSSRQGEASCGRVHAALAEIADRVTAADRLVAEIATAAQEQAQGIRQIGTAMTQLDQVTQENAARANEGATGAADLTAQAGVVRGLVDRLRSLVVPGGVTRRPATPTRTSLADRRDATHRPLPRPAPRIPMPEDASTSAPLQDAEDRHFRDF